MPVARECACLRLESARSAVRFQPANVKSTCRLPCTRSEPFMPRDHDKHNDSRGRPNRPGGGKGRSGDRRGGEKKFEKRRFSKGGGEKSRPRKPYSAFDKADGDHREDRRPRVASDNPP